jgi:hypothetical protein
LVPTAPSRKDRPANYTPKALEAMGKNPNTNRREAVEKLLTAACGKLVAM